MAISSNLKKLDLASVKTSCETCSLSELCLPRGLDKESLDILEQVVRHTKPLQRGQRLFSTGDSLGSLYALRSGSMKLCSILDDGDEQIAGFYLPGEILGLDGVGGAQHTCTAIALETSSVCAFPYERLLEICKKVPSLQDQMFRVMGREISQENQLLLTVNRRNAEQRVAAFILSLSGRFKRMGYSPHKFKLSMSRQEIGNYLGLTIETVSRVFSKFQKAGLIAADRRAVHILELDGLQCAGGSSGKNAMPSGAAAKTTN